MMIAKAVAKALLCEHKDGCGECAACKQVDSLNHPDVIYITHEKYEIRVDDIRKGINETIDIKPYSGDYKIYIIDDADRMNAGAQNALLKTLEEPPAYAVILLLTNNKDRLLDTILSRCVSMTLGSVRESEIRRLSKKPIQGQVMQISHLQQHFHLGILDVHCMYWIQKNLKIC